MSAPTDHPDPYPIGHYHSPIPSLDEIRNDEARIFHAPDALPGIDLRADEQLRWLDRLAEIAADLPYRDAPNADLRYHLDNELFGEGDATVLWSMLQALRPARYLEIGSGYSSAVAMDVNEHVFGFGMQCTFIEPDITRLRALCKPDDHRHATVIEDLVQRAPLEPFDALDDGDVLFIDSSHVARIGSDVNYLFFEVLPRLAPGVVVHVHDIFYPFEYPKAWVYGGRAWNEAYLLRAFLTCNDAFELLYFNDYIATKHRDALAAKMPGCLNNTGGSIWLRRTFTSDSVPQR